MALPLLFSFLGGGLAKAGVLGAAGSFLANPLVASAIGSGIGSLAQTGDPKKALMSGLGSFAGGKLLGGMMGGGSPATSTGAVSGPMTESLRPMARPEGLGSAAGVTRPGIFDASMDFAKSGAGIGSAIGGALPGMMQRPPSVSRDAPPDLSTQRPMQRDVQMPGEGFQPGVSGEFDYGVSAPYTTDYMSQYAPQKRAMGGMVENPYAQNYAEQRGEMMGMGQPMMQQPMMQQPMMQPPVMGMYQGGGVEMDHGFQVQRSGAIQQPSNTKGTRSSGGRWEDTLLGGAISQQSPLITTFFNRMAGRVEASPQEQIVQQPPRAMMPQFEPRPQATPTPFNLTSAAVSEGLDTDPMRMAQGGTVQRMVPGYGPIAMQAGGIAEMGAMPPEMGAMPPEMGAMPPEMGAMPPEMGAMAPEMGAAQPNEREVISAAIAAIQGQHPQPEVALGMFLQQYGEDALRDLVDRVQSGEMGETAAESQGQLAGPGDGMNDMIPATIDGQQDVLLSDGEYIVPADVVSGLGNGSSDAGSRALDQMLERVRMERTGRAEQAPEVPQERMMPV